MAPFAYRRRQPETTALYHCVQAHLATFVAKVDGAGASLPKFIRREFDEYLRCGILANGFVKVHCGGCGFDRLVAFSCKGRAFCPSCGGRRMTETAANLVDRVLPYVPVRQWVLSLPPPLRYLLAYDSELTSAVLNIFLGEVFSWLRREAKSEIALASVRAAHTGSVTVIQRFGSALNLNVHLHALVADGVFVQAGLDRPAFRALRSPTKGEIAQIAWRTCVRTLALLKKRGQWIEDDASPADQLAQSDPLLAQCYAASISGTLLLGPNKGQRVLTFKGAAAREGRVNKSGAAYGFDVDAAVRVPAHDRMRLERLCKYVARPPLGNDRLEELADGHFRLRLKTPWANGTTHLIFDGVELIGRLVALVPPPRANQVRYHGVFGPNSKLRRQIVPRPESARRTRGKAANDDRASARADGSGAAARTWAELMKRVWAFDVLECPRCHSQMQRIASIIMPSAIRAVLKSVGEATAPPERHPARVDDDQAFVSSAG